MAVNLIFSGEENENELQVFVCENRLYVQVSDGSVFFWVGLSKQDAFKFSKEIKKQINIINRLEKGVDNG